VVVRGVPHQDPLLLRGQLPVTLDEIRATLFAAAAVRMPRFTEEMSGGERVSLLEDYLNLTAITRGDLDEARLCAQTAVRDLTVEWDAIVGWEAHLRSRRRDIPQHEITAAKREIRPELHDAIAEAKFLVARLGEQIDRLSHMGDDQVASRLYSLITGT
jgi:hypothetical protein